MQPQTLSPFASGVLVGFMFLAFLVLGLWTTLAPENFTQLFSRGKSFSRPVRVILRIIGIVNLIGAMYVLLVRIFPGH